MSSLIFIVVPLLLLVVAIISFFRAMQTKNWRVALYGIVALAIGASLIYYLGLSLDTM